VRKFLKKLVLLFDFILKNVICSLDLKHKYESLLKKQDFFEGKIQNLEYENKKLLNIQETLISTNEELSNFY